MRCPLNEDEVDSLAVCFTASLNSHENNMAAFINLALSHNVMEIGGRQINTTRVVVQMLPPLPQLPSDAENVSLTEKMCKTWPTCRLLQEGCEERLCDS